MKSFSCDLSFESKNHVAFLQKLHEMGVMTAPLSQHSADRYLNCWLPLLAEVHKNKTRNTHLLVPPPDVAWLSHCHRLAPGPYRKYLLQQFQDSSIDESCQPFAVQIEEQNGCRDAVETRLEWNHRYPQKPFFWPSQATRTSEVDDQSAVTQTACDMDGFQLVASAKSQATFLWQVSDPRFQDIAFLQHAVDRYHKFLQLSGKFHRERGSSSMIVPTYDIDLMWHTHILYSSSGYESDCIRIRGSSFNHDDSLNDRSSGSNLEIAFQETCDAWEESYQEPYMDPVHAVAYRGEPPIEYFVSNINIRQRNVIGVAAKLTSKASCFKAQDSPLKDKSMTSSDISSSIIDTTPLSLLTEFRDIPWVNAFGLVPGKTEKAFIAIKSSGPYPKKDGYVLGRASVGEGYFSLCTREAYSILLRKLRQKEREAEQSLTEHDMDTCRLCLRKPTAVESNRRTLLELDLKKLRVFRQFVLVQYKATGPYKRLCDDYAITAQIARPFPLDCIIDKKNLKGITLGDVCDAVDCGGFVSGGRCKTAWRGYATGGACGGGGCGGCGSGCGGGGGC